MGWAGIVTFGADPRNYNATPVPAQPAYLQSYVDPDFHSLVTRISDSTTKTDGTTNFSSWSPVGNTIRNHYRVIQPWNSDMSLILLQNESFDPDGSSLPGPSPKRLILDGNTYAFKFGLTFDFYDSRWNPRDPDILFYTAGNRLLKFDVRRRVSTLIHAFTSYPAANGALSINNSNPSADGRWFVLAANSGRGRDFILYDTTALRGATARLSWSIFPGPRSIRAQAFPMPILLHPWATVSPSGNYIVMFWSDALTEVYDRSFHFLRTLTPSGMSHFDVTDDGGTEYVVGAQESRGSGGYLYRSALASATARSSRPFCSACRHQRKKRGLSRLGLLHLRPKRAARTPSATKLPRSTSTRRRLPPRAASPIVSTPRWTMSARSTPRRRPTWPPVIFQSNWANRGEARRGTDVCVSTCAVAWICLKR